MLEFIFYLFSAGLWINIACASVRIESNDFHAPYIDLYLYKTLVSARDDANRQLISSTASIRTLNESREKFLRRRIFEIPQRIASANRID